MKLESLLLIFLLFPAVLSQRRQLKGNKKEESKKGGKVAKTKKSKKFESPSPTSSSAPSSTPPPPLLPAPQNDRVLFALIFNFNNPHETVRPPDRIALELGTAAYLIGKGDREGISVDDVKIVDVYPQFLGEANKVGVLFEALLPDCCVSDTRVEELITEVFGYPGSLGEEIFEVDNLCTLFAYCNPDYSITSYLAEPSDPDAFLFVYPDIDPTVESADLDELTGVTEAFLQEKFVSQVGRCPAALRMRALFGRFPNFQSSNDFNVVNSIVRYTFNVCDSEVLDFGSLVETEILSDDYGTELSNNIGSGNPFQTATVSQVDGSIILS
jgi:hypothetical protein